MGDHEIEKDRSKRAQRRQADRQKRERREERDDYTPIVEHNGHRFRARGHVVEYWPDRAD